MLKSIFISAFLTALSIAVGHSAWMLWQQPDALAWWGVILSTAPMLVFLGWVFVSSAARTANTLWPVLGISSAGVVLLAVSGNQAVLPWVYALGFGLGGNLTYEFWYSRFGRTSSEALKLGSKLPAMSLEDEQGNPVNTDELSGALLLMFYRGNWCPLCMAQIREVAEEYQALAARGVQTLLISSQPHDNTASLARKFDVDFRFLVDKDNQVARKLGILAENGTPAGLQALGYTSDTAMPTVVLTDASKTIIFCDETDNYRVRPEPATFLRLFDEAAGTAS